MAERDLSLAGELLLLAIDPARGGLFRHRRARFRRALAAALVADRGGRRAPLFAAWRARRLARAELERAELATATGLRRRLRLLDGPRAAKRFHRLCRCIREDDFPQPRDRELLLLLAWSGVLSHRLSRDERRLALRRLQAFAALPPGDQEIGRPPPHQRQRAWEGTWALGAVAALGGAELLFDGAWGDLGGVEGGAVDAGAISGGGDGGN